MCTEPRGRLQGHQWRPRPSNLGKLSHWYLRLSKMVLQAHTPTIKSSSPDSRSAPGGDFLNFSSFWHFFLFGPGRRGKRFLGPVSPPVHLSGGRRTQIGPLRPRPPAPWPQGRDPGPHGKVPEPKARAQGLGAWGPRAQGKGSWRKAPGPGLGVQGPKPGAPRPEA